MTRWRMFTEWLADLRQERLARRALRQALEVFSRLHPDWHEALFDEPFLRRFDPGAVLVMDPRELATEWSRQIAYSNPRRRDREIARVAEVAAHFQELMAHAVGRLEERGGR